jgi:hypothetical protein
MPAFITLLKKQTQGNQTHLKILLKKAIKPAKGPATEKSK